MENTTIVIEKSIESLDDLNSVIGVIENKLKETSKLILLLLEPKNELENEHFDNVSQHLLVKLEEQEAGDNSDESKHLPGHIEEQAIDNDHDNKQAIEQISRSLVSSLTPVSLHDLEQAGDIPMVNYAVEDTQEQKTEPVKKKKKKKLPNRRGFCKECNKEFAYLYKHKLSVHERRTWDYTCPICNLEFKSVKYAVYFDHKQKCEAAATGVMKYQCPTCGLRMATTSQNVEHQRVCNGSYKHKYRKEKYEGKHICTYEGCDYRATRDRALKAHINRVHLNIPIEKNYSCDTCGNSYANPTALKHHIKIVHDQIKDLFCSECGASFSTHQHLTNHKKIHADATCQCPFCPKAFKQKSVLYRHKLSCPMNPDK